MRIVAMSFSTVLEAASYIIAGMAGMGTIIAGLAYFVVKNYRAIKQNEQTAVASQSEEQLEAQRRVTNTYKDLFDAERIKHELLKQELIDIRTRIRQVENEMVVMRELNVSHQQRIEAMRGTIGKLRSRLDANKIEHEDIE